MGRTLARLDLRHKVAQLVLPRVSGAFLPVGSPEEQRVRRWVVEYGVGGLIETLGPPMEAAAKFNALQRLADVPLLITADMEHGPGQLLNGGVVLPYGLENGGGTRFPPAMGLGAANDERLAWELGRITAIEGRAAGVHLNFAPVVDVNNNPANPIINTRSYGADPAAVGRLAAAQIRGMQDHGMLATAKHFPGHGDTGVDSHNELPVITADPARADSVELKPYRDAIAADVAAIMSAHIAFPGLTHDSMPATLSPRLMGALLRDSLAFRGLAVTDALDMGAIVSRFGAEEAPILALEAGADLLLQVEPEDVGRVIEAVVAAVRSGRLDEARIDRSVRRVLEAKASLGLHRQRLVDLDRMAEVIGRPEHLATAAVAAERSLTLVRDRDVLLPLARRRTLCIVYREPVEPFAGRSFLAGLREATSSLTTVVLEPDADPRALDAARAAAVDAEVVIFAPFIRVAAGQTRLALPEPIAEAVNAIALARPTIAVSFGNPYLLGQLPAVSTYLLAWAGWEVMQRAAARALSGAAPITGRLPIPLPPWHAVGDGITVREAAPAPLPEVREPRPPLAEPVVVESPATSGFDPRLPLLVDSLVRQAIGEGAAPGAAVAIGRRGRIALLAGYGRVDGSPDAAPVTDSTLYDMASLTKVLATTTAAMLLVDEGRLALDAPVSRYLAEWPTDTAHARVTIRHLLRHDAGLPASASLWRRARGRQAFLDGIVRLPLAAEPGSRTVYSDLGLILMGFIIERLSGMPLDAFIQQRVAGPLGLRETGFNPLTWLPGQDADGAGGNVRLARWRLAPTELDTVFRMRLVNGRVHDENAYALGGVAGHAGLFSSARDVAVLADMLLSGGSSAGRRIVREETVREFTRRQSQTSSRALGWDTPAAGSSAGDLFSAASFGHTGFTGTSVWIDPERDVFVVLLANRVHPTRANQRHVQLRRDLADLVQRALMDAAAPPGR